MRERKRNIFLLLRLLPSLVVSGQKRKILRQMMAFVRQLPQLMKQPLPVALARIGMGDDVAAQLSEQEVRDLADLASALERRSVPGICLKRSLTRYRFLAPFELSLQVVFGATHKKEGETPQIAGHAWLEIDGDTYWESVENYETFTPIFRWPQAASQ